jgi:hypothetical protein
MSSRIGARDFVVFAEGNEKKVLALAWLLEADKQAPGSPSGLCQPTAFAEDFKTSSPHRKINRRI